MRRLLAGTLHRVGDCLLSIGDWLNFRSLDMLALGRRLRDEL